MKKSSNEKIDINRITPDTDYGLTDKHVGYNKIIEQSLTFI